MVKTLKFQIIMFSLSINLIIIVTCVLLLHRSVLQSRQMIVDNYSSVLSRRVVQADDTFKNAQSAIFAKRSTQFIRDFRKASRDETSLFYFYQDIRSDLDDMHYGYPSYLNFFFYNTEMDYLIINKYSGELYQYRSDLTDQLLRFHQSGQTDDWSSEIIDGSRTLIYEYQAENMVLGFFSDLELLLQDIGNTLPKYIDIQMTSGSEPAPEEILSGNKKQLLQISADSRYGLTFYCFIESPPLNQLANRTIFLIVFALGVALLSIFVGLLFYNKKIFLPLRRILFGLKYVQDNDLSYRLNDHSDTREFNQLSSNFNEMVKDISALQEEIVQEQKAKQEMELAWLMHQIRPHFILNNLNQIYTLAERRDYEEIQSLSHSLSDYMRYVLRTDAQLLSVREELNHIENYLSIWRRNHPDNFEYRILCSHYYDRVPIPTYLINTILENCLQHAWKNDEKLQIEIRIFHDEALPDNLITLLITDNGIGFDDDMLRHVNTFSDYSHYISSHIGLRNIKYRLHLLYQNRAEMKIYNKDSGGAAVRIDFPDIQ